MASTTWRSAKFLLAVDLDVSSAWMKKRRAVVCSGLGGGVTSHALLGDAALIHDLEYASEYETTGVRDLFERLVQTGLPAASSARPEAKPSDLHLMHSGCEDVSRADSEGSWSDSTLDDEEHLLVEADNSRCSKDRQAPLHCVCIDCWPAKYDNRVFARKLCRQQLDDQVISLCKLLLGAGAAMYLLFLTMGGITTSTYCSKVRTPTATDEGWSDHWATCQYGLNMVIGCSAATPFLLLFLCMLRIAPGRYRGQKLLAFTPRGLRRIVALLLVVVVITVVCLTVVVPQVVSAANSTVPPANATTSAP